MPRQCCFLCASDEGVFLDITADNKQIFHEKFETCSLVKVPTADQLPTKLCHKCAYELNQCSSFVQKFKRCIKQRTQNRKSGCSLCNQPAKNEFIFDLSKDQSIQHDSFDRIQKVFNYDLNNFKDSHKFICLSCRYTLDLLFDLKNVSKETAIKLNDLINEKIDYGNFPKIQTVVVNRKTTITESARINLPTIKKPNSNSTKTCTRFRNNVLDDNKSDEKLKSRVCDKCQGYVKTIEDMYKIHKSKSTVCKKCWRKMAVDKDETENQGQQNLAETKVCKVFLEDVLKNTELKEQKAQLTNQDGQSNKAQVVTGKSVENETKPDSKMTETRNGMTRQSRKRIATEMKDESRSASNEQTVTKKSKVTGKQTDDESKEPEPTSQESKLRKVKASALFTSQVDSDSSTLKRKSEKSLTAQKQATGSSLSDADIESKHNRKKLRNILKGISVIKNLDSTDESSSNENITPTRKRTRFSSTPPVLIHKKSEAISKKSLSPQTSKAVSTKQLKPEPFESDSEGEVIFDTTTYVCDECGASYENKLMGLTHKLTHYKQIRVELQKLQDKDIIKETPDTTEATDEQSKDRLEIIAIRVDDDDEEESKDTSMTESNAEDKMNYFKKEAMEDAVDMELVMKESDDDYNQATEKEAEDSQKKEEAETNVSTQDETESKKQDENSNDNNNSKVYKKKQSINAEEKGNASLSGVENTQEEKENAVSSNIEDTQEEKENASPSNVEDMQEEKPEEEEDKQERRTEEDGESKVENNNENEDTEEKIARTERKDSSEEEVISLSIWEAEPEATEGSHANSTNDKVNDDEIDSSKPDKQEQSVVEEEVEVEITKYSSSERTEKPEFSDKDQSAESNKTSSKPVLVEHVILLEENTENENVSISKSNVSEKENQNDCVDTAAEVLQEVIDLASAEVQKRRKSNELDNQDSCIETETVENISREIQNSIEVPSLG